MLENGAEVLYYCDDRALQSRCPKHSIIGRSYSFIGHRPAINEQRILMLFKIVKPNRWRYPQREFLIPNNVHTRGHNNKYRQLQTRLQCYQGSFFPDTIKLWNKLPDYLANLHDLISFREDLTKIINT